MNSNNSGGTSSIAELPFNNMPLNTVETSENRVIENKIQNELNNRDSQTQIVNNPNRELSNNLEQGNNKVEYNTMISDLQKASQSGATSLPSRDIPMNTNNITQDEQIQPNYIPNDNQDYIGDNIMIDNTINNTNNQYNRLDDFYNNLQTPLLLTILYFIFQLPIIKKYLFKFLPNLFGKDGNQNIYGHIFYSILFSLGYVCVINIINKLNEL